MHKISVNNNEQLEGNNEMSNENKLDNKTKCCLLVLLQIDRIAREQGYPEMMLDDKTKTDYEDRLIADYEAGKKENE